MTATLLLLLKLRMVCFILRSKLPQPLLMHAWHGAAVLSACMHMYCTAWHFQIAIAMRAWQEKAVNMHAHAPDGVAVSDPAMRQPQAMSGMTPP